MIEGNTSLSRFEVTESIVMMMFASKNSEMMMKQKMQASAIEMMMTNDQKILEHVFFFDMKYQPLRFVS